MKVKVEFWKNGRRFTETIEVPGDHDFHPYILLAEDGGDGVVNFQARLGPDDNLQLLFKEEDALFKYLGLKIGIGMLFTGRNGAPPWQTAVTKLAN